MSLKHRLVSQYADLCATEKKCLSGLSWRPRQTIRRRTHAEVLVHRSDWNVTSHSLLRRYLYFYLNNHSLDVGARKLWASHLHIAFLQKWLSQPCFLASGATVVTSFGRKKNAHGVASSLLKVGLVCTLMCRIRCACSLVYIKKAPHSPFVSTHIP